MRCVMCRYQGWIFLCGTTHNGQYGMLELLLVHGNADANLAEINVSSTQGHIDIVNLLVSSQ